MQKEILLQLKNIFVNYGEVKALDGVDIFLDEGEIVSLMGQNGAGKSTVLKAIFGLAPIYSGKVLWHGNPMSPVHYEVAKKGMAFVPQGRRVFENLTIQENLEIGGFTILDKKISNQRIGEILEIFPDLKDKLKRKAGALSGGQQQMLALGRGLMTDPKVLLLDEPSLGLAPKVVKEIFIKIKEINEKHKTAILVVEHNIRSLLEISHRVYVMDKGKVVAEVPAREFLEGNILEKVFR